MLDKPCSRIAVRNLHSEESLQAPLCRFTTRNTNSNLTGDYMTKVIDPIGHTYGKLTILQRTKVQRGHIFYECLCTCGETVEVSRNNLLRGNSSQCNECGYVSRSNSQITINKKKNYTTYISYTSMKLRCSESIRYIGVPICDRWLNENGFLNFLEDMGDRPDGCTLDRIDNSLGYEKSNCRWTTASVQNHNKKKRQNSQFESIGVCKNKNLFLVQISKESFKHSMTFDNEKYAAIYYDNVSEFFYGDRPNKTIREPISPCFGKLGSLNFESKSGNYRVRFSNALGKRITVYYSPNKEEAQEMFDLLEQMLKEKIYFDKTRGLPNSYDFLQ